MNNLRSILVSDSAQAIEDNFDLLEAAVFTLTPNDTVNGPPTTGTHELNELWVDQNHAIWVCYSAGTPGSWKQLTAGVMTGGAWPTGAIPTGYVAVHTDLDMIRFRYDGSGWVRINRRKHVQTSAATVWNVNHGLGFNPATVQITVGGQPGNAGIEFVDTDNLNLHFIGSYSGEVVCE